MNLQKINIVGAGPSGLYFAILTREYFPYADITIFERGAADDVAGWGIVIIQGTVRLLEKYDPDSYKEIVDQCKRWSDVDIRHNGEHVRARGKEYISLSRNVLVSALRKRCEILGIKIVYDRKISDPKLLADCDLLVGADGASSVVREAYQEFFEPEIDIRKQRFSWMGTRKIFDTITHISKSTPTGIFTAECYGYSNTLSSFIPNCDEDTWRESGFGEMSIKESARYLSEVFADELEGEPLLSDDASRWRRFPHVTNKHWSHENVVLLGDALRTAHFSIGSGTRLAIEDAVVATQSLSTCDTVPEALMEFEKRRRPLMTRLQDIASESMRWFENIEDRIDLDIVPFTYEIMTRASSLGERSLKLTDPEFLKRYQEFMSNKELAE
jgi:anthraniloyl-CoA monooxygenase